jgi:hypothetical protein
MKALHIAAPCPEEWRSMPGDARARFCARCELHVENLAELRDTEAEAVLARTDERVCVRVVRDGAGNLVTRTTQEARFLAALRTLAAHRAERAP